MGAPRHEVAPVTALAVDIRGKAFAGPAVLGEIRFELAPGERAAVIGASGVGKSTLLNLIAGFDAEIDGAITRPAGRIAMAFQTPRLLPWRTLAENIAIIPGSGGLARARALLAEVGLGAAADLYPERASLGMQRRAALARVLAIDPSLILLDEPLVSLDPATAAGMREQLATTFERTGAACLIATHDRREALALADRVLELGDSPARIIHDRTSPLDRTAQRDPAAVEAVHGDWYGDANS